MNEHRRQYLTYHQELLAFLTPLNEWKHLLSPATVVYPPSHPAAHLGEEILGAANRMVLRYLAYFTNSPGLTIAYKPGKENVAAECPSRNPLHKPAPLPTTAEPSIQAPRMGPTVEESAAKRPSYSGQHPCFKLPKPPSTRIHLATRPSNDYPTANGVLATAETCKGSQLQLPIKSCHHRSATPPRYQQLSCFSAICAKWSLGASAGGRIVGHRRPPAHTIMCGGRRWESALAGDPGKMSNLQDACIGSSHQQP
ncbi:hypothetical protein Efla_002879 [Eimeria flavescens]